MANQTANRFFQHQEGLERIALFANTTDTTWYKGAAVGRVIDHATAALIGRATKTLDGTVYANFAGVIPRQQTTTEDGDKIAVMRRGAYIFDYVDAAGSADSPDLTVLGKPVFFRDDHSVSLTPPAQAYPILAGHVIGVGGAAPSWGELGDETVLVEIDHAVEGCLRWFTQTFYGDLAILNAEAEPGLSFLNNFSFNRRVWLRRAYAQCGLAVATGTITFTVLHDAAGGGAPTEILDAQAVTGTLGAVSAGNVNKVYEFDDHLEISIRSDGNTTAGQFSVTVEGISLD